MIGTKHRKQSTKKEHFFCLLIVLGLGMNGFGFPAYASLRNQTQDMGARLKVAQDLERSGRLEEAVEVYESLYDETPRNVVVYTRLKNLYMRTRNFVKARRIIEARQKQFPADPSLAIALANIDYREGKTKKALRAWWDALDRNPKSASAYSMVAGTMLIERLMDEACEVYLLGRKRVGKEDLFALQLANLYGARMEFGNAAAELLVYWKTHQKQHGIIESTLLRYPKTERVVKEIVPLLRTALLNYPESLTLRQIVVRYMLHNERADEAFDITREMERLTGKEKQGQALFQFGQATFNAGMPDQAEKAYREILQEYTEFPSIERVRFGLGEVYEALEQYDKAVQVYHQVAAEHPRSPLASRALYHSGLVQKDDMNDPSAAEGAFRWLLQTYPNAVEVEDGYLALADCAVTLGHLAEADSVLTEALKRTEPRKGNPWIRVVVRKAELSYLRGQFEKALAGLEALNKETLNPSMLQDPLVNDGLTLRLFLETYSGSDEQGLKIIAGADLLARQKEYTAAIAILDSIIHSEPYRPAGAQALFRMAELQLETGQWRQSKQSFESLVTRFGSHVMADRAIERMGWIHQMRGETKQAVSEYERLLEQYPQSFLADEIRKRIRRLEKE